jgi:hypothetical protein
MYKSIVLILAQIKTNHGMLFRPTIPNGASWNLARSGQFAAVISIRAGS